MEAIKPMMIIYFNNFIKSHRVGAEEYSTMKVGPLPSIQEYSTPLF